MPARFPSDDHLNRDESARQYDASQADAALLADRRRQAALRLVRDGDAATTPTVPDDQAGTPLFEAVTSAIGGDVDAAGERLLVWSDRVELRDGRDRVRGRLTIDDIGRVDVRKRLTSATLTVVGADGRTLVLKGVKAASAARFRDTVAGLKLTPGTGAASTPTAEALRRIKDLAAMGLLTEKEVAEKRALLAQRSAQPRG
jgi:hypothetical protein